MPTPPLARDPRGSSRSRSRSTLLSAGALPPIPAAAASVFGLFVSGLLAGKLATTGRTYHGAVVGAGFVLCEALGIVPGVSYVADPLSDTAAGHRVRRAADRGRGAGRVVRATLVFFGYGQSSMTGQIGHFGVGVQMRRPCSTRFHVAFTQSFFG